MSAEREERSEVRGQFELKLSADALRLLSDVVLSTLYGSNDGLIISDSERDILRQIRDQLEEWKA
jgi:hypothetical protein